MRKNIIIALSGAAAVAFLVAGCQKEYRSDPTARIDGDKSRSIYIGDTTAFKFIISPADEGAEIAWGVSDESVVHKDQYNARYVELVGLKRGEITVYATVNGHPELTDTCTVEVKEFPLLAEKVVLSKHVDTLSVKRKYTDTLTYAVFPGDAEETSTEWSIVSHPEIVAINQDGVICALAAGEATVRVTVTSEFRKQKAVVTDECKIRVFEN